jgi:hypothetical protein
MAMGGIRFVLLVALVLAVGTGSARAQCATEVVYAEDFEGGVLPLGWKTTSELWNVVASTPCANTCQQGYVLYGGAFATNKCTCQVYDWQGCGSAIVYSPLLVLPEVGPGESLLLDFCVDGMLDTLYNSYCNRLSIEHPAGETFKLGPHMYLPCVGPETLPPYDLTPYAGDVIRLGWYLGLMDSAGVAFLKIDDVRILRTRPSWPDDCNTNGIPDACEMALGHAPDCNRNGVPDECDLAAGLARDCNRNSIPDVCDVSSGASTDLDGNGLPDECQCTLETYCPPAPNSASAAGAQITSTGSTSIATNDFAIQLNQAPKGKFCLLLAGRPVASVPFQNGWLCLGQPLLSFPPKKTNTNGILKVVLDFNSYPASALLPLEDLGFQFWFRDPAAAGAGANLSEGLHAVFCP